MSYRARAQACLALVTCACTSARPQVDLTKYLEKHAFKFDESLDENVSNEAVYQLTVGPLVRTLFRNGRASCFAYGQTGSGKTYTMSPLPIRASADIFTFMAQQQYRDISLCVSCFEIYGNKVWAGRPAGLQRGGGAARVRVGTKGFGGAQWVVRALAARVRGAAASGSTTERLGCFWRNVGLGWGRLPPA